jgi:hypothetical protein
MKRGAKAMSAYGPKQTCRFAPHASAFGGKADMPAARLLGGLTGPPPPARSRRRMGLIHFIIAVADQHQVTARIRKRN